MLQWLNQRLWKFVWHLRTAEFIFQPCSHIFLSLSSAWDAQEQQTCPCFSWVLKADLPKSGQVLDESSQHSSWTSCPSPGAQRGERGNGVGSTRHSRALCTLGSQSEHWGLSPRHILQLLHITGCRKTHKAASAPQLATVTRAWNTDFNFLYDDF